MNTKELNEILRLHLVWLDDELGGRRAYLYKADLRRACLQSLNFQRAYLIGADLSESDLQGTNFFGADLSKANLVRADLCRTDLSRACLKEALLSKTKLHGAKLHGARLTGADLTGADLSGANLCGAYLDDANLSGADLGGVYLGGAYLYNTKLPDGCEFYDNLPRHNIIVIHDVAHIGCHSLPLSEWIERGPEIGDKNGYTEDEIEVYMEILRKEHEARRTE
jgi:hypothetical protein